MRLLWLKPRYGPSSAFVINIFFALKRSKLFYSYLYGCPHRFSSYIVKSLKTGVMRAYFKAEQYIG